MADEEGPLDGILGFSQGAAAAALLVGSLQAAPDAHRPLTPPKFAIFVGGYLPEPFTDLASAPRPTPASFSVPSLHILSQRDTAVPAEQSLALKSLFAKPLTLEHDLGHCVPQRSAHVAAILDFITKHSAPVAAGPEAFETRSGAPATGGGEPLPESQAEELEALEAIFAEELEISRRVVPVLLGINLGGPASSIMDDGDRRPSSSYRLVFRLPRDYPATAPPGVTVEGPLSPIDPMWGKIQAHVQRTIEEHAGMQAVYAITESVRDFLDVNLAGYTGVGGRRGLAAAAAEGDASGRSAAERLLPFLGKGGDPYRLAEDHWCLAEENDAELIQRATQMAAEAYQRGDIGPIAAAASSSLGSRWNLTVGLVGKPSAGKSTLFNATLNPATDEQGARVGAFPFTTINPQLGRGFFAAPCPCVPMGVADTCAAGFGHVAFRPASLCEDYSSLRGRTEGGGGITSCSGPGSILTSKSVSEDIKWRRVPILIKDVAGLVPGAYQGRGKGNAFLNDLVEADVLIHVIDASGTTDSGGNAIHAASDAASASDPLDEVKWVRAELHLWVFENIKAKWASLIRRPERLGLMFSGYHASPAVVEKVLASVGLQPSTMDQIRGWSELDLHRLVANFIRIRFPMVLGLNKADIPSAEPRIRTVLAEMPWEPAVAVSAQTETWLCKLRREGLISYTDGAASVHVPNQAALPTHVAEQLRTVQETVLSRYGGTGVLAALTAAAALKSPALAFPVADVHGCQSLRPLTFVKDGIISAGQDALQGADGGLAGLTISSMDEGHAHAVLRDCAVLHPGSGIDHLFRLLSKPPVVYLEGDFVRAEGVQLSTAGQGVQVDKTVAPRPWKREEALVWAVVRIMTTRKSNWQHIRKGGAE